MKIHELFNMVLYEKKETCKTTRMNIQGQFDMLQNKKRDVKNSLTCYQTKKDVYKPERIFRDSLTCYWTKRKRRVEIPE